MCLGRDEEAAQRVLANLADSDGRSRAIEELEPEAMQLFYTRSRLPHPRDLLERDERVRNAFLAVARQVPEEYYPAASLKR
jgi:hypothetical protein